MYAYLQRQADRTADSTLTYSTLPKEELCRSRSCVSHKIMLLVGNFTQQIWHSLCPKVQVAKLFDIASYMSEVLDIKF